MEEKIIEANIEEKSELIKPELKTDINAKVISLGKIEDNISEVKDYALELSDYYQKVVFTPETMKEATDEKAQVNKFKTKIADFRKNIVEEYKKPINLFEKTAKETENILKNTYEIINTQVLSYQETLKEEIKVKVREYFEEYRTSKNIDEKYISFEELNVNITLGLITEKGSLTKKIKDEINSKVDSIASELETIRTMQNSDEVLVEYLKHKNLSQAIKDVNDRHFVLETLKEVEKESTIKEQQEKQVINQVEEVLQAPQVEETIKGQMSIEDIKQEKISKVTFTVLGTYKQLKELKDFLIKGGYKYE